MLGKFFTKAELIRSVGWNLILLTIGSFLYALGIKAIAVNHGFITGGLFGTSLLIYYVTDALVPHLIFAILNVPLLILGYIYVGRRFILYTIVGVVLTTLFYQFISIEIAIKNQFYAAVTAGFISGSGVGLILRSLGSGGGLDILAVILNNKFNFPFGRFYFIYNLIQFSICAVFMDIDLCIASIILFFVSSNVIEYILSSFSQRKVIFVISEHNKSIARQLNENLNLGSTFIKAQGAFSGLDKDVLMTVASNFALKRLEAVVFDNDASALFIVSDTNSVLGKSFSKRKIY